MDDTYALQCGIRAKKATPGPWQYSGIDNPSIVSVVSENSYMFVDTLSPNNAKFIANARKDVPELADRLTVACAVIEGFITQIAIKDSENAKFLQNYLDLLKDPNKPVLQSLSEKFGKLP